MIDKSKLKKFLKSSNYNKSIKLFILDVLKTVANNPTSNGQYLTYIMELDLFEEGFFDGSKLSNTYYLIDFLYLDQLDSKIHEYYINLLREGLIDNTTFSFSVNNTTILIEHGILISNIEHLKLKRQKKLEEIKAKKSLSEAKKSLADESMDDFFDFGIDG